MLQSANQSSAHGIVADTVEIREAAADDRSPMLPSAMEALSPCRAFDGRYFAACIKSPATFFIATNSSKLSLCHRRIFACRISLGIQQSPLLARRFPLRENASFLCRAIGEKTHYRLPVGDDESLPS